ncbi:GNAT family N-acetyltransferase [Bacillus horti]|uniref:RimJ/RimL family protein N-acetyltransferase n=1 Tax=Caldalkalibacillus horti TaxID=77523 RepID=A0ABT9W1G9_9BACI|nr:GNAT family protein [Bacillus horti]MDQ0167084.1 RimJ/RimL family protein N-acetyltransferase [Bacillus horti]
MNKRKPKGLEGELVYLSPVSSEDANLYYDELFDPEARKLTGTKVLFTFDQVVQYLKDRSMSSTSVLCFIVLQKNDEIIGDIALQDIDTTNRSGGIRISINKHNHQGRGYGTEALKLMLDYGFGQLNLHRIELTVYDYNERAIHVYEKVGFKVEGRLRDALYYDHAYHDTIFMSILEDEFRQLYKQT